MDSKKVFPPQMAVTFHLQKVRQMSKTNHESKHFNPIRADVPCYIETVQLILKLSTCNFTNYDVHPGLSLRALTVLNELSIF